MISDDRLRKTTVRILGRDAFPKPKPLSPAAIVALRARVDVSQGVLAGYLNLATSTIGQWERGERRPSGAALKLLHLVKRDGIAVLEEIAIATKTRRKPASGGKARLRAEIVEMFGLLRRIGKIDDARLRKTTLDMLERDAFPPLAPLSPAAIVAMREKAGLS